jgi:hypothetical protein
MFQAFNIMTFPRKRLRLNQAGIAEVREGENGEEIVRDCLVSALGGNILPLIITIIR